MITRLFAVMVAALMLCATMVAAGPQVAYADDEALASPANPHLEFTGGPGLVTSVTAAWDTVPNADGYYLIVRWDGMNYSSELEITGASAQSGKYDISDIVMSNGGAYSFEICAFKAAGEGTERSETAESDSVDLCVLTVVTGHEGANESFRVCAMKDSSVGELVSMAYIPSLTQEGADYTLIDGEGVKHKLFAVASDVASRYSSKTELAAAACWPTTGAAYANKLKEDMAVFAVWDTDMCTDGDLHNWEEVCVKATFTEHGSIGMKCSKCGEEQYGVWLPKLTEIKLSKTSCVYNGKPLQPSAVVMNMDGPLNSDQYTVTYSNNTNVGTATAKVELKSKWYEGSKTLTFKITQAGNSVKPAKSAVKKSVKVAKVKKKAQKIALPAVKTQFGKATWSVAKKDKKKVLSLKAGKIVVKKGAKKGTYTMKVKASVKGTANYKAATSGPVTVKVTVK